MSDQHLSKNQILQKLEQTEALLEALRRGEVDLLIGTRGPLVVQLKSLMEEKERLQQLLQLKHDITRLMVHEIDRLKLLQEATELLCRNSLFHTAFISLRNTDGSVPASFQHGDPTFVTEVTKSGLNTLPCIDEMYKNPSPLIVVEPRPFCRTCSLVKCLELRCSIIVPISHREVTFGALAVSAPKEWAQDERVIQMCKDLGKDLGFALYRIEQEKELEKTKARLEESEQHFRSLFENAPVGIAVADMDGKLLLCNPAMLALGGYHPEDLSEETHVSQFYYDLKEREIIRQQFLQRGFVHEHPVRFKRKDGSPYDALLSLSKISYKGVSCIQAIVLDITPLKEAQDQVAREQALLRTLIDSLPDSIYVKDKSGKYLVCNLEAARRAGLSNAEELVGKTDFDLFDQDEAQELLDLDQEVLRTGEPIRDREYQVSDRENGQRFYLATRVPLKDDSGSIYGIVGFDRDITELRKAEIEKEKLQEQLNQAQKVEAIGRLAGGVAHDFNNMLGVILGYGEILLSQLDPNDPMRGDIVEIVKAAQRSASLTRQLLAFSRKQTLRPEILDLNHLLRDLEKMLRRMIGEDIVLELALAENLYTVKADPGQIEQVIMNLVVNARDAMPKGGRLLIETQNIELDEEYARRHIGSRPGKYVLMAVSDTGIGMDRETMDHIFEPFFSTKEKGKGTGLGLSTVYGIVKQSGGNIWVYSEKGKGTTFKVYLPECSDKAEAAEEKPVVASIEGKGETILVVEDEQSIRRLIATMLKRYGYKVAAASTGAEAIEIVEKKGIKPDLVITDVVMPEMSGAALVNKLKASIPQVRVLYMSGYTDNAIVHHGILDPGTPYIQKPFNNRDLARKIRELLNS